MKKLALLTTTTLMIFLCSSNVDAQNTRAGIKGGMNFSNLFVEDIDDENMRVGYHFGVRYNYGLQKVAESDIAKELLGNSKNGFGQVYAAFLFGN